MCQNYGWKTYEQYCEMNFHHLIRFFRGRVGKLAGPNQFMEQWSFSTEMKNLHIDSIMRRMHITSSFCVNEQEFTVLKWRWSKIEKIEKHTRSTWQITFKRNPKILTRYSSWRHATPERCKWRQYVVRSSYLTLSYTVFNQLCIRWMSDAIHYTYIYANIHTDTHTHADNEPKPNKAIPNRWWLVVKHYGWFLVIHFEFYTLKYLEFTLELSTNC